MKLPNFVSSINGTNCKFWFKSPSLSLVPRKSLNPSTSICSKNNFPLLLCSKESEEELITPTLFPEKLGSLCVDPNWAAFSSSAVADIGAIGFFFAPSPPTVAEQNDEEDKERLTAVLEEFLCKLPKILFEIWVVVVVLLKGKLLLWSDWGTNMCPWELELGRSRWWELLLKIEFGIEFADDEISLTLSSAKASQNALWVMKLSFLCYNS